MVYEEARDEDAKPVEGEGDENVRIPGDIAEGQKQKLVHLIPEQHFTQPPPRFHEASLVQALEEHGIGRPSTYAPIMSTIQERGYVVRVDKRLEPTETGVLVNDMMVQYFPDIVDMYFTARMEDDLDKSPMVRPMGGGDAGVLPPLCGEVQKAQAEMPVTKSGPEPIGRACPECGKDLVIRFGRYGKFISCSGFPTCRYTEPWLEKIGVECPGRITAKSSNAKPARAASSTAARTIPIVTSPRGSARWPIPARSAADCWSSPTSAKRNASTVPGDLPAGRRSSPKP